MAQWSWCINVSYATTKLICISIALWTVCLSVIQLGIFSWQISDWQNRSVSGDRMVSGVDSTSADHTSLADHSVNGVRTEWNERNFESLSTALNVMHIINLLLSIILLITGIGLTYFIWIDSKLADMPWAVVFASSILGVVIWCIVWWAYGVHAYWLMLTVVEFLFSIFNSLCLIYAIILHRRFMTV